MSAPVRVHRHGGAALIELLIVISLFAAFVMISGKLFADMLRLSTDATRSQAYVQRYEHVLVRLRADVWNATDLAVPDPQTVRIQQAGGRTITWRLRGDRDRVVRTEMVGQTVASEQPWPGGLPHLTFHRDGPVLVLRTVGSLARRSDQTHLVSQVLVLKGPAP